MHRTIYLLLIAIVLAFTSCVSRNTAVDRLTDADAIAGLGSFIKSAGQLDKAIYGEVAVVHPSDPVILVSSGTKKDIEDVGGSDFDRRGGNIDFKFETPMDKCNWFINLISFPLEQKIVTAPGITTAKSFYDFRMGNSNYYPTESYDSSFYFGRTWTALIDDLDEWNKTANTEIYFLKFPEFRDIDTLILQSAVEIPGGDSWFDNMKTSFRPDDIFTFHMKAFTRNNPGRIILGDVKVPYSQIYPFLSELVIGLESVGGLHPLDDAQKQWVRSEPVKNIDAFGEFLAGYARRPFQMWDVAPPPRVRLYMNRIYGHLENKDPDNTPSMVFDAMSGNLLFRGRSKGWQRIIKIKPYLGFPYERFVQAEADSAEWGTYDGAPIFKEAVEIRPDIAWLHMEYAGWLLRNSDFDGAVAQYRMCEGIEPGIHIAYSNWVPITRDKSNVIRFAEMVHADYPDDLTDGTYLARLYGEEGENEKAIELYTKYTILYPDYVGTWIDLAGLCRKVGDDAAEKNAWEGFLNNVDYSNDSYGDDINRAKARLAALSGDIPTQIASLLADFPYLNSGDGRYLDLAEALEKEGDIADALYLAYRVIADLDFNKGRFFGDQQERYDRAVSMKNRLIPVFWPEFDASKVVEAFEYKEHYDELEKQKKILGVREVLPMYKQMLTEYPSMMEASNYELMASQVYYDNPDALLEAKLINAIISEAIDETGYNEGHIARSGLRNWGEGQYTPYLRRKLLEKYGEH
jgi:tetratricopeptide (TPR) repeat protein